MKPCNSSIPSACRDSTCLIFTDLNLKLVVFLLYSSKSSGNQSLQGLILLVMFPETELLQAGHVRMFLPWLSAQNSAISALQCLTVIKSRYFKQIVSFNKISTKKIKHYAKLWLKFCSYEK